jgi:hypothetical protein
MNIEEFVNESIRLAVSKGYVPTSFMAMRERHGTIEAINRLLRTSDPQSGYRRMVQLDLKNWALESAVEKFPDLFPDKLVRANASARLKGILDA